jgi:hypothetical protein
MNSNTAGVDPMQQIEVDSAFLRRLVRMTTAMNRIVGSKPDEVFLDRRLQHEQDLNYKPTGYVIVRWKYHGLESEDVQIRLYAFNPYDPGMRPEVWEKAIHKVLRLR